MVVCIQLDLPSIRTTHGRDNPPGLTEAGAASVTERGLGGALSSAGRLPTANCLTPARVAHPKPLLKYRWLSMGLRRRPTSDLWFDCTRSWVVFPASRLAISQICRRQSNGVFPCAATSGWPGLKHRSGNGLNASA